MKPTTIRDIWEFHGEGRWVVITTNIGWKKDGSNPMGAGLAKQAYERYPALAKWYGMKCQLYREKTALTPYFEGRLFLFPTKALSIKEPWMSWKNSSDLKLVEKSTKQLLACVDHLEKSNKLAGDVGVPLVGCLNGGLKPDRVIPILEKYLDNRFVLIEGNR